MTDEIPVTPQIAVSYREAVASDVLDIARLHADSWRRHYRGAYPPAFFDSSLDVDRLGVWSERLANPQGSFTLVCERSGLVAFVHVCFNADARFGSLVDNLHVRHDLHRNGIARHLMAGAAAAVAHAAPGKPLYLWVLEQNVRAQAFYRAIGGSEADRHDADPPALPGVRRIRYVWPDPKVLASLES